MKRQKKNHNRCFTLHASRFTRRGFLTPQVLVFSFVATILLSAIITWVGNSLKDARFVIEREKAFYIAEAGLEYYRWHLAHAPNDFKDGTATSGPYIHPYYDAGGNNVGQFELTITAPVVGSTIATVRSKGVYASTTSSSRTLEARLAIPSIAKYAFVANSVMRFGEGTVVFGPIHSNDGIRFDGLAHNIVTSAKASYNDPDNTGNNEFGVHTHLRPPPLTGSYGDNFVAAEAPPSVPAARADVFEVGRSFPVPAVDFNGFTSDLASMKTSAQSSGRYIAPSGDDGYQIILKTNDTFDLYRVNTIYNPSGNSCETQSDQGGSWGIWSINTKTFIANYAFPSNGIIFVEDHVWVQGTVNTARLTVASGRFPEQSSTNTDIIVNNDILYTNYDGTDVVALVAQRDVSVGMVSENDLEIDAALLAKNGRVGRHYYGSNCSPYDDRAEITVYGMIGTSLRYGFAYTDGTGYVIRNIVYDANLLYSPPPDFPLAGDQYQVISWREI